MSSSVVTAIPMQLIKEITGNFSIEKKVGSGGSAEVYKGVLNGHEVAVKKFYPINGLDNEAFENEFANLLKVRHENILRLIGYSYEIAHRHVEYNGQTVFAQTADRVLCFEYMHEGSLAMHISAESCLHDWPTTYKIIKGTCEGLHYLHKGRGENNYIYHMELTPDNILLDEKLVPKIGGFGLSRLFGDSKTYQTNILKGTIGFMAPESINHRNVSPKNDVFSLGVIIFYMIAGEKGYTDYCDLRFNQVFLEENREDLIESVQEYWKKRMQATLGYISDASVLIGVRKCIEIAISCVETDRDRRPTTTEIIDDLNKLDAEIEGMSKKDPKPLVGQTGPKPRHLPLQHLKDITNNFCDERVLGRGGFGVVYKGLLKSGEMVAVKKLLQSTPKSVEQFENEVNFLMKLKHPNIVQLVGYCYETQHLNMLREGELVFASNTESFLCLDYMSNGSLDKYITDAASGLDWHTRCKIIEGICFGLQYLHEQSDAPVIYLDLKPAKILLDENMVPKITDFCLSRQFDQKEAISIAITSGTLAYVSPEYIRAGIITPMSDIFSLGVIIMEVITGHRDYPYDITTSSKDFIELELKKWRNMLQKQPGYTLLETDFQQIKRCIQIGLICVNPERSKRPTVKKIIDMLQGLESMNGYISNETRSNPQHLPLQHLKDITNNFCDEHILGKGGFGVVYKGLLENGEIVAVKKLLQSWPKSVEQFENEVNFLMKLKHPNIVRLVGYCYETQHLHTPHEGKFIFAWDTERLICLDYMCNGSLDKYITDASSGLDWHTRCKIIEGICYGLQYLHDECNDPIIHLDLKPANILLDENMVPRITDFGLSRLFDQNRTIQTAFLGGTRGYMPPEFIRGIITPMSDIFSLGVIIMEVITGHRDYPYDITPSASENFIELELQKWRNVLERKLGYTSLQADCERIKRYIQIGLICVNLERTKRPAIKKIIDMLQGLETVTCQINELSTSQDTQAEP